MPWMENSAVYVPNISNSVIKSQSLEKKNVHEADFSRNTKKSLSAKPGEKGEWGHDLIRALQAKGKDMSSMSWQ